MRELLIDRWSSTPLYVRLVAQIHEQILDGVLREGDALPSIRNMASERHVSVITVKRAYDELEREGVIRTLAGKGCYVTASAAARLQKERFREVEKNLQIAVELSKKCNISPIALQEMLRYAIKEPK